MGRGYVVYVLVLENGCLYVGETGNLEWRIWAHTVGSGARCVRGFDVEAVLIVDFVGSEAEARRLEREHYYELKRSWDPDRVRGAGNTGRFRI